MREGANLLEENLGSRLDGIETFGGVAREDLRWFELHARVMKIPKGRWLFMEGDPRSEVYCLVDGRIKISRLSRSGKEVVQELVEPGELFGESSLFEDGPHDSFGAAFEDSRVATLPARELANLMKKRSDFAFQFAMLIELRRKKMERRLVAFTVQKVRGRIASLLLQGCLSSFSRVLTIRNISQSLSNIVRFRLDFHSQVGFAGRITHEQQGFPR